MGQFTERKIMKPQRQIVDDVKKEKPSNEELLNQLLPPNQTAAPEESAFANLPNPFVQEENPQRVVGLEDVEKLPQSAMKDELAEMIKENGPKPVQKGAMSPLEIIEAANLNPFGLHPRKGVPGESTTGIRKTRLFEARSSPAKSIRLANSSLGSLDNKFQVLNTDAAANQTQSLDFFDAQNVLMSRQDSSDNEMSEES